MMESREDQPVQESALAVRGGSPGTGMAVARRVWQLARQVRPSREAVAVGAGLAVLGAGSGVLRAVGRGGVLPRGRALDIATPETAATVTRTVRRVLAHRVVSDGATTVEVREAYLSITETVRTVTGK